MVGKTGESLACTGHPAPKTHLGGAASPAQCAQKRRRCWWHMSPRAGCCGPLEGRRSTAAPCPAGCPAAGCFSSSQKPEGALSGSLCELLVISRDVACGDFSLVGKSCPCWKCKHMHATPQPRQRSASPRGRGQKDIFSASRYRLVAF